jgi:hypothetical protein
VRLELTHVYRQMDAGEIESQDGTRPGGRCLRMAERMRIELQR